jgi:hypothetical protein
MSDRQSIQALHYVPTSSAYDVSSLVSPVASLSKQTAEEISDGKRQPMTPSATHLLNRSNDPSLADTSTGTYAGQEYPRRDIPNIAKVDTPRSIVSRGNTAVDLPGHGGGFMVLGGVAVNLPSQVSNILIEQLRTTLKDMEQRSVSNVMDALKLQTSPKQQLEFLKNLHEAFRTKKKVTGCGRTKHNKPKDYYIFRCSGFNCVRIIMRMGSKRGVCESCRARVSKAKKRGLSEFQTPYECGET